MPEIPPDVYTAVDAALDALPQPDSRFERDRWRIASRIAVEAAAPLLAEHIAQMILAHMERHWPPERQTAHSPRRHFGIAARVAAGAFFTDEETRQMAAEAIARGNFMMCRIPEDPAQPREDHL